MSAKNKKHKLLEYGDAVAYKPSTLIEKYNAIQSIGVNVEVPFHVWSQFGDKQKSISIVGSDISLGEDYASLEGARAAVEWYASQLGGKVKWS